MEPSIEAAAKLEEARLLRERAELARGAGAGQLAAKLDATASALRREAAQLDPERQSPQWLVPTKRRLRGGLDGIKL